MNIDDLRGFIESKSVIKVVYDGGERIVEPYLIYESKDGALILHSWQTAGAWTHTPPPDWANLSFSKIRSVSPTGDHYAEPQAGYNPHSDRFFRVICHV